MRSLRPSWREYQTTLQRQRARRHLLNIGLRLGAVAAVIAVGGYSLLTGLAGSGCQSLRSAATSPSSPPAAPVLSEEGGRQPSSQSEDTPAAEIQPTANRAPEREASSSSEPLDTDDGRLAKQDLRHLMKHVDFTNLSRRMVYFKVGDQPYNAETYLDIELQQLLVSHMDRKNSRYIGIVALEPDTGRVVTMASFDKTKGPVSPCLSDKYPAASLFKIVSAVAAAEEKGYRAGTVFKYNGYAHTLYKRQLKETNNKYTNRISFQNAFAKSVNPVFGKIGALYLQGEALAHYAEVLGFNRQLPFELPIPPSNFTPGDKPYRWAELASGFNRETTISPLHAAVIVGAVVNGGRLVEPTVIASLHDAAQEEVYRSKPQVWARVMDADTAATLRRLMETTVRSGTGRKVFRRRRRDKVLSKLVIGGKTGTIYNRAHDARFDWFAGYAREKKGSASLVVAVVVAHEEFIGRRAGEYARLAFRHYFEQRFAREEKAGENGSAS
ncbi:MAG: penicillin-binding transpeptidase domain-containing protein [Desulfosarcinaceae bacterium]